MNLISIEFSDSTDYDTVFALLKGWYVHVDLHDGRRFIGKPVSHDYITVVFDGSDPSEEGEVLEQADEEPKKEFEVEWDQITSVEIL